MSKKLRTWLATLLLLGSILLAFGVGYVFGLTTPSGDDFASIEQAWNILLNDYVERDKVDTGELSRAAIKAMLEVLDDPYSTYMDRESYQFEISDTEGKFDGIGAEVTISDGQLTIISPFPDSPAARAGVKPGDVILEIDGLATSDMGLMEAVLKVRGQKGTSVRLLILHQDETEPVEIEVVRDEIALTSVRFEMKGDIAYIRISQFTGGTNDELTPVLEALAVEAASGIVLDLRYNPGGLLEAVVDVVSRFLEEGVVVIIQDNKGNKEIISVSHQELTTALPMVVLVNGFSASGSEVLAGALKDHGRATIAGSITFGKGSVNFLSQLADGSGLYITGARWLTPDGDLIEGRGIVPDVELELTGDDAIQWAIDYLKGGG